MNKRIFFWTMSIGIEIIAALIFKKDGFSVKGWIIWVLGIGVYIWGTRIVRKSEKTKSSDYKLIVVMGVIFGLALGIRLYRISKLPPGLWIDEVENGIAGVKVWNKFWQGDIRPFWPDATGHPGLSLFINGFFSSSFGKSIWSIRFPVALVSSLSIVVFGFIAKELGFNNRKLLMACLLITSSYWHLTFSRIGYESGLFWLCQNLAGLFLIKYIKTNEINYLTWANIYLGFGVYTYLAFRSLIIVVPILLTIYLWKNPIKLFESLVISGYLGAILLMPLAIYNRKYPNEVNFRANDVSIFNQKFDGINRLKMIGENSLKTLGMLVIVPDPNIRHNMSQRSVLNVVEIGFFFAGIIGLFVKKKYKVLLTFMVIFGIGALNGILTYEPPYDIQPHSLRTLGMLMIIYLAIGYGLEFKSIIISILVIVSMIINIESYFGINIGQTINQKYMTGETKAALKLKENCGKKVRIQTTLISKPHFDYLADGCEFEKMDYLSDVNQEGVIIWDDKK